MIQSVLNINLYIEINMREMIEGSCKRLKKQLIFLPQAYCSPKHLQALNLSPSFSLQWLTSFYIFY